MKCSEGPPQERLPCPTGARCSEGEDRGHREINSVIPTSSPDERDSSYGCQNTITSVMGYGLTYLLRITEPVYPKRPGADTIQQLSTSRIWKKPDFIHGTGPGVDVDDPRTVPRNPEEYQVGPPHPRCFDSKGSTVTTRSTSSV